MRFALLLLLCLSAAGTPAFAPAYAQDAAEIAFWESVRDSQNPAELQAYLDAYPTGAYAALAKIRIGTLGGTPAPATQPQPAAQATAPAPAKSGPQIAPDKASYAPFEQITISWSGLPASLTHGWIALYRQGETTELNRYSIDLTKKTGSTVVEGQRPGAYDAVLLTPPYGSEYKLARTAFTVAEPGATAAGEGPALTLTAETAIPFEPIEVGWSGIGDSMAYGWVRVSKADGTEVTRLSFDSSTAKSGTLTFEGTLPGEYVFDLLSPPYGSELLLASARLTIIDPKTTPGAAAAGGGPALTLASETIMPFEPIDVGWSGVGTSMTSGWVRMSKADGTEITRQSFDSSTAKAGSVTFDGTLPGDYVFDLLSPPYGSELLLASARLTVIDPNAVAPEPEPAAVPEPAPAPEPQPDAGATPAPATTDTAAADAAATGAATAGRTATGTRDAGAVAAATVRSTLGNIAFADPPAPGDANLGPLLMAALEPEMVERCTGPTESFRWTIGAGEDARLQALLNDTVLGLKGNGYEISQVPVALDNALVYKAAGADRLLMAWVQDEEDQFLGLVLCPTQ